MTFLQEGPLNCKRIYLKSLSLKIILFVYTFLFLVDVVLEETSIGLVIATTDISQF